MDHVEVLIASMRVMCLEPLDIILYSADYRAGSRLFSSTRLGLMKSPLSRLNRNSRM